MSFPLQLLTYFLISHMISFLCSILEAVLLSCTPFYVHSFSKTHPKLGAQLISFKKLIDRPLAAILSLNTAAHTFGAAGIGATVEQHYGEALVTLASVIVTLTMLYLTEMIPKTIGALYWKSLLPYCIPIIQLIIKITLPLVLSFEAFANFLRRGKKTLDMTKGEIKIFFEEGIHTGVLEALEQQMVANIFQLSECNIKNFMVSRSEIQWLDCALPKETLLRQIADNPRDVYFLCENSADFPLGWAYAKEICAQIASSGELEIKKLAQKPCYFPENGSVLDLLESFSAKGEKVYFVVDEYGGLAGVTLLDTIFSALTQDIYTYDSPSIVRHNNHTWSVDGNFPITELSKALDSDFTSDTLKRGYHTVAGLCLIQLQKIPKRGDSFSYNDYRFAIKAMERQRIRKVLITLEATEELESGDSSIRTEDK